MAVDSSPSISVHVTITIDPSNNEAFLEALKPSFEAVKKEPLNASIEVFQDAMKPGAFRIVENWNASIEYMHDVQRKKDYYEPYFAATEPMYLKPLEVSVYNRFQGREWKINKEA
ncbi:hypothetical protein Daus18300_006114 [Diaporthe australafricana]|uniref:ABM domain-containing protein n=1 Tax=Diaporthe australafricana TaxID=127596 RepID=A0ABR3WXE8_9PEZI